MLIESLRLYSRGAQRSSAHLVKTVKNRSYINAEDTQNIKKKNYLANRFARSKQLLFYPNLLKLALTISNQPELVQIGSNRHEPTRRLIR